jgi:hypothetical protein
MTKSPTQLGRMGVAASALRRSQTKKSRKRHDEKPVGVIPIVRPIHNQLVENPPVERQKARNQQADGHGVRIQPVHLIENNSKELSGGRAGRHIHVTDRNIKGYVSNLDETQR